MRNLVILPTYNEAPHVIRLCEEIVAQHQSLDVLVVDDNSPDGTGDLVDKARSRDKRLHLIRREKKLGLGTAYLSGFRFGLDRDYASIFTMDCDLSHNPRYLPDLLGAMDGFDLAIGSRYIPGGRIVNWPFHRRALSLFANFYTRLLLRLPVHDCTSGYRCYSRRVLDEVHPFDTRASGYSFQEEMVWRIYRYGFRIREVPIVFEDRVDGKSKIDFSEIYLAAWRVLKTALQPPALPNRKR